jgi:hypothetical protein
LSEPIVRPLSWIVTVTAVAVVILGARAVSGRRAHPAEAATVTPEAPAPAPPRAVPAFRPAAPAPRVRAPAAGLAHLRGRVVAPAGSDLDELKVVADDGESDYEAETNAAGEFQLHLPARVYTLTATLDRLVGVKVGVRALPGDDQDVTLSLGPGATISGVIRHAAGREETMEILVERAGTSMEVGKEHESGDGRFEVGALVPGALYDVTVSGERQNKLIRAVTAPATLEVVLPEPVTLSGAIGFAAGTKCPFQRIALVSEDEDDLTDVDRNCHFRFENVAPGQEVVLKASGGGWHLEEHLSLPAQGDPEPACLNPPCRELPPEEPSVLDVILTGAPGNSDLTVSASQDENGGMGCTSNGHQCTLRGLDLGVPAQLTISAPGCVTVEQQLIPGAGLKTLTIPCRRMRLVEGVARGGDAAQIATIACPSGGTAHLRGNSVFELHCPRDVTELRYRKNPRDPWRSTPLPPDTDPVFVELTL